MLSDFNVKTMRAIDTSPLSGTVVYTMGLEDGKALCQRVGLVGDGVDAQRWLAGEWPDDIESFIPIPGPE